MDVIPAIDVRGGRSRVVYWPGAAAGTGTPTDRPEVIAERFVAQGARAVHLVDVDGAQQTRPANLEAVGAVASRVAVPLQVAGGLEEADHVRLAFAAGATRVVLSLAIVERPAVLRECLAVAGDWLAVGLDPRPDRLAAFPWRRPSTPSLDTLVEELVGLGVQRLVLSHGGASPDPSLIAGLVARHDLDVLVAGRNPRPRRRPPPARRRRRRPDPRRGPAVRGRRLPPRPGDRSMTFRRPHSLLAVALLVAACGGGSRIACPSAVPSASADPTAGCPTAQPPALPAGETRTVTLATEPGAIVIKVTADLSPIATGNFVALAECGWYDGVVFHRIVPEFVIQGGDGQYGRLPDVDPELVGTGGPGYEIQDEPVTTEYHRGTVAMARSSQPNSVGSQFFIVLSDDAALALGDPRYNNYQIIGEVTSGMDAVDAIAAMPNSGQPANQALEPLPMTDVTVATP